MSVSKYAYVNARIGGMKSYLLREEDLRGLIESRNIDEAVSLLKSTNYGSEISESNILSLELQLKKSLYRDYLKLINCVEGRPEEFIHNMARKYEIDTIKSIIKMKFLNISLPEYLIPFGKIDEEVIERLLRAEGVIGVIKVLKGTEYYEPLSGARLSETEVEDKGGSETKERELPYLNALDLYYFDGVKESMEKLSKKDRSIVKRFVGFNIDLSNLLMALRLRGVEGATDEFFIEGGESFTAKHFFRVRQLENLSRLPDVVPGRFVEITTEGLEKYSGMNSLIAFELITKRKLLKESKKLFLGDRFHIGTIIAYLNLKENEISNLIKILKTKDEFFSTKEIEELLVLV
jgi:ATP synthase A1 C subunit